MGWSYGKRTLQEAALEAMRTEVEWPEKGWKVVESSPIGSDGNGEYRQWHLIDVGDGRFDASVVLLKVEGREVGTKTLCVDVGPYADGFPLKWLNRLTQLNHKGEPRGEFFDKWFARQCARGLQSS